MPVFSLHQFHFDLEEQLTFARVRINIYMTELPTPLMQAYQGAIGGHSKE